MKCEQAEMAMAELLAGEVAAAVRSELEAHLLECAACRADFETARAGFRAEWPDRPVPAALAESTLAALREPPAAVRFLRMATAAAAAFLVGTLLLTMKTSEPPRPAAVVAPLPRQPVLASVQAAVVGTLSAKDEEGRPVGELGLKSHTVSIEISDGIAKTTVEENFRNHTDRRLEGTFLFPLPPDASISRLALEVNGKIEEGTCLERERAREVFEGIVRKMQDPALLEWMPGGMFKCRVFPIEPRATKRVIVAYTQALPCFQGKMSYVYPLASEKTQKHPPEELRIDVRARFGGRLAKVESPSHRLDIQRADAHQAAATLEARNARPESDFVLSMEVEEEVSRVVSHKLDGDDGYFALFLTPKLAAERKPRLTTFVLDVSASVSAPELEVAKKLVRAMMERRIEGDRFVVMAHNVEVETSGVVELREANAFLDRLSPVGACDVLKALQAAEGEVVYIGEGTPTFGETDHARIIEAVKGRKILTVGVGSDANVTLLEKLGGHFRVSPNDLVDRRVAEIAATFGSPAITGLRVEGGDAVYDVVGVRDIFAGERLVVTGRYRGPAAKLVVTAEGWRHELEAAFPAKEEGNNYVRRLWAQRKVADLLAAGGKKEEVTALGVKHQIMTPFTSFLVLESEQMWKDHHLKREVQKQDEVLGKAREEERRKAAESEVFNAKVQRLLDDGTRLYKQGKPTEAYAAFEEAFQYKPSSDLVAAHIKKIGQGLVAGMMNEPDRKVQDVGRRLLELSKPGEPFREVSGEGIPIKGKGETPASGGKPPRTTFGQSTILPVVEPVLPPPPPPVVNPTPAPVPPRAESPKPEPSVVEPPPVRPPAPPDVTVRNEVRHFRSVPDVSGLWHYAPGDLRIDGDHNESWDGELYQSFKQGKALRGNHAADYDIQIATAAVTLDPILDDSYAGYIQLPRMGSVYHNSRVGLVSPTAGGGGPLTGATFTLDEFYEAPQFNSFRHGHFTLDVDAHHHIVDPKEIAGRRGLPDENVDNHPDLNLSYPGPYDPTRGPQGWRMSGGGKVYVPGKGPVAETEGASADGSRIFHLQNASSERVRRTLESVYRSRGDWADGENTAKSGEARELERPRDIDEKRGRSEGSRSTLSELGIMTDISPKKPLDGKVTAMAPGVGLVMISIGKDAGVLEGDEFTVFRGQEFVAKIVIDRADRRWAAGQVVLMKFDPRVGDDVSNHIFVSGTKAGGGIEATEVLAANASTNQVGLRSADAARGQLFAIMRDSKFVALVMVSESGRGGSLGGVWRGLAVGRVLPGDRAVPLNDPAGYLAGLPEEVRMDLASRAAQRNVRAKMGIGR